MSARLRRLVTFVGVTLLCILAVRAVFAAWAVARLQEFDERCRQYAVDAGDGRERAVPPGSSPATGSDSCCYQRILQAIPPAQRDTLLSNASAIVESASRGAVPGPGEEIGFASACEPQLRALAGSTCTQGCPWDLPGATHPLGFEDSESVELARAAAGCLVIEGNRLYASGKPQAGVEWYVKALRVGADLRRGDLLMYLAGLSIASTAVDGLTERMSSSPAGTRPPPLLDALPSVTPTFEELEEVVETERRKGCGLIPAYEEPEHFANAPAWSRWAWSGAALFTTRRAIGVYFVTIRREQLYQDLAEAVTIEDPRGAVTRLGEIEESAQRSWHPALEMEIGPGWKARRTLDDLLARFRLLVAAARLEQQFEQDGVYPLDDAAVDLPDDPFSPSRAIRYQSLDEGQGYRLWSVGFDLVDDGGSSERRRDLVLERRTSF